MSLNNQTISFFHFVLSYKDVQIEQTPARRRVFSVRSVPSAAPRTVSCHRDHVSESESCWVLGAKRLSAVLNLQRFSCPSEKNCCQLNDQSHTLAGPRSPWSPVQVVTKRQKIINQKERKRIALCLQPPLKTLWCFAGLPISLERGKK